MDQSYSLRIDSGDRRGEKVRIPAGGLVLGRAGDADVVLADPSVSTRHARLEVAPDGVRLVDLGSRNGTRVGAERIEGPRLLAHGDRLRLGHVAATFLDGTLAEIADPESAEGGGGAEGLQAERLGLPTAGRSAKRLRAGLLVAAALLAVAAFAARDFLASATTGGERSAGAPTRAPEIVEGDLLGSASFEGEPAPGAWAQAESTPFAIDRSYRRSGELGFGADLAAGETVELLSAPVRVRAGAVLEARSHVRLDPGIAASQAIVLESAAGDRPRLVLHGARAAGSEETPGEDGFTSLVSSARVLSGFDAARFALHASAGAAGMLALDDVSLAPSSDGDGADSGPASIAFEEFELLLVGEPAVEAVLLHIDRPLLLGVSVGATPRAPGGPPTAAEQPFEAHATALGFELVFRAAGTLSFVLDDALAAEGLATRGSGGFRSRTFEFEADDATDLVAGASPRLVRLGFGGTTELRVRPVPGAGVAVTAGPVERLTVQLAFRDERARAGELAVRARRAEKESTPADAIAAWGELLSDFPFDRPLVAEAVEARARLIETGLAEVAELRRGFERARFFKLADIYRRGRVRAEGILARYAGSEVAIELEALLAEIDAAFVESVDVERELQADRLRRVADILAREGADGLADHVRDELEGAGSEDR